MATKPLQQPEIWASQLLYASGPKAGQPTKATSESGAAVEGHKPGPTEPTTANEFNIFENKMSLLARWGFAGRFDKMADAHPVETDSSGLLSARAADFGDPASPGPSLSVVSSSSDWAARITATDNDGLQVQGVHTAADASQLALITSNQDNIAQKAALRVVCSSIPSAGGIQIDSAAAGVISGEQLLAAMSINNLGGTGLQVRTSGTILPAARFINLEDGGTSARFGHGDLETGSDKNLDGTAIDAKGGDADGSSGAARAGSGALFQGGAFTLSGTPKPAGHGILALSGQTDAGAPGGAAVFAQTVGPRGIAVEASHNDAGATLPVIQATTGANGADAFKAVCKDGGRGMFVQAESGAGVSIQMDPEAGTGDLGVALDLQVQLRPDSVNSGSLWNEQISGRTRLRAGLPGASGLDGPDFGYVRTAIQPPCYARSNIINNFVTSGTSTVDAVVAPEFSFQAGQLPQQASKVKVTIWGEVAQFEGSITSATFAVRDKTVGGDPKICSITVAHPDTGGAGFYFSSTTFADIYQLPAAGARTFDLVWSGSAGTSTGNFDGWVEIEEIQGD